MGEDSSFDPEYLFASFGAAPKNGTEKSKNLANISPINHSNIDIEQNNYIKELEEQNAKLKSVIKRLVGPQLFKPHESSKDGNSTINLLEKLEDEIQSNPFAIVIYLNNDISNVHRKEIDDVMRCLSDKKATQDVLMAHKLKAQHSAVPLKAFTANFKGKRINLGATKEVEEQYVICACQYYKGFIIDRMGAPLLESNPGVTEIWDIPVYQQVFLKALPIVEEPLNVRVKQLKQCFNCGGEHHLTACREPKDKDRISKNRLEFAKFNPVASNQKFGGDEPEERFRHFKPGTISEALQEALGISLKTHLPPYIYKMRQLGYPPSWLKPMEESLKIYGIEGFAIEEPGAEEGEIATAKIPEIIMYPGFNAPVPEGVQDQSREMNFPEFQPDVGLQILKKRAALMGYSDKEPIIKRLKFDNEEGPCEMDIALDENDSNDAPPLPLIEVINSVPPLPEELPNSDVNVNQVGKLESSKQKTKCIDNSTYRNWYHHIPLSSVNATYVMYTSPPVCRGEVLLENLPKYPITDIDRNPWKTANVSWWDPIYGDLSAPTGTFDAIRTLLTSAKRVKRKPMI
ncbi:zinc finger CCHC domain-containing protein 8 [Hydra vulgaris]|nr:zinc finger CCHC domain-containing protein 8 [Hydra vulgaris]